MTDTMGFNEETILHFSLRYALPRRSTASSIVSNYINTHMSRIGIGTLNMMALEINQSIELGQAGDPIDVAIWTELAQDINNHLQKL